MADENRITLELNDISRLRFSSYFRYGLSYYERFGFRYVRIADVYGIHEIRNPTPSNIPNRKLDLKTIDAFKKWNQDAKVIEVLGNNWRGIVANGITVQEFVKEFEEKQVGHIEKANARAIVYCIRFGWLYLLRDAALGTLLDDMEYIPKETRQAFESWNEFEFLTRC